MRDVIDVMSIIDLERFPSLTGLHDAIGTHDTKFIVFCLCIQFDYMS